MPYEIKHKSDDLCLIKYVKVKKFRHKNLYYVIIGIIFVSGLFLLPLLSFAIFCFAVVLLTMRSLMMGPTYLEPPAFEIELNRVKDLVSIRNSEYLHKKPITYPLSVFKGLDVHETVLRRKSKTLIQAELLLKIEPIRGLVRKIPVRKGPYIVSPDNAADIVEATNKWMRQTSNIEIIKDKRKLNDAAKEESAKLEKPPIGTEILRDFRDME